ncbi:uncharacterized protein LOC124269878 [Haliotis rubra]|uniref:uncharacterized protein LOC124269878 n=1 Tax=Haliotis rubra TaxID=36100 RepID=UPI001EE568D9|nr:uncharacterized protein LOC124269878 [Haliotis rubra]
MSSRRREAGQDVMTHHHGDSTVSRETAPPTEIPYVSESENSPLADRDETASVNVTEGVSDIGERDTAQPGPSDVNLSHEQRLMQMFSDMHKKEMNKVLSVVEDLKNQMYGYEEAEESPSAHDSIFSSLDTDQHESNVPRSQCDPPPAKRLALGDVAVTSLPPSNMAAATVDGNSLLSKLASSYKPVDCIGEPVQKEMADLVNDMMCTKLEEKQKLAIFDKHLRPENCDKLMAPRVNSEIWRIMEPETRNKDISLQKSQNLLCKGIIPIVKVVDSLTKEAASNLDMEKIVSQLMDGLALFSLANYDISLRRRDSIRGELRPEYKALCTSQTPVTGLLFGDNLSEKIKELSDTSRMGLKMTSHFRKDFRPSANFPQSQRGRPSFRFPRRGGRFLGRQSQSFSGRRPQRQYHLPRHQPQGQNQRKERRGTY